MTRVASASPAAGNQTAEHVGKQDKATAAEGSLFAALLDAVVPQHHALEEVAPAATDSRSRGRSDAVARPAERDASHQEAGQAGRPGDDSRIADRGEVTGSEAVAAVATPVATVLTTRSSASSQPRLGVVEAGAAPAATAGVADDTSGSSPGRAGATRLAGDAGPHGASAAGGQDPAREPSSAGNFLAGDAGPHGASAAGGRDPAREPSSAGNFLPAGEPLSPGAMDPALAGAPPSSGVVSEPGAAHEGATIARRSDPAMATSPTHASESDAEGAPRASTGAAESETAASERRAAGQALAAPVASAAIVLSPLTAPAAASELPATGAAPDPSRPDRSGGDAPQLDHVGLAGAISRPVEGSDGSWSVSARLEPGALGTVRAAVRVDGDSVHVLLDAASDAGHRALASNLDQLAAELARGGRNVEVTLTSPGHSTVQSGDLSGGQHARHGQAGSGGQLAGGRELGTEDGAAARRDGSEASEHPAGAVAAEGDSLGRRRTGRAAGDGQLVAQRIGDGQDCDPHGPRLQVVL
jgi:hypothetical protein